jgi:hypothetical protein
MKDFMKNVALRLTVVALVVISCLFLSAPLVAATGTVSLTLSTTAVSFPGSIMLGASSPAQYVLITSTGTAPLQVTGVTMGGTNPGDFLVTDQAGTCTTGTSLINHAECNLRVVFAPTAVGTRSAILYITDNASGSPQQVTVSATATSGAQLSASSSTLTFPITTVGVTAAAQYITIKSTGFQPLIVNQVVLGSGDFDLSDQAGTCTTAATTTLVPGADCNIRVRFHPTTAGSKTATVLINNNSSVSPYVVTLSNGTPVVSVSLSCPPATYDGNSHGCVAIPTPSGATCSGLVSGTNAGSYPESVTCGSAGFVSGTATATLVISDATQSPIVSCPGPLTYDGNAHSCTITGGVGTCTSAAVTDVPGSGTLALNCTGDSNHNAYSGTGSIAINPATPTLSMICSGGVYTGSPYSCTGSATGVGGAAVSGAFAFAPGSETNAGSYPETGIFTSSNPNYASGGTASGTLVITPATPSLSLTCALVTGNGSPQACAPGGSATGIGAAAVAGTWTYTYNGSPTVPSAGGTYTVVATFTSSNSNYASGGTASDSFVISLEPTVAVSLSCPTVTYNGAAQGCTATPTPAGATCSGLVSETNAGSYPESVTCANAGYTAGSATGTLVINPATPTLSATCSGGVYNGAAYSCTGSATGVGGAAVSGSFAFAPGSETNVGSYPETGAFTSANTNYVSGGTATATLIISDATQSPIVSCPGPLTYDGNAHSCTITGGFGTCTSAAVTNVPGSGTLALSCSGDSNHNAYSGTGSITINPATPTLSVTCGTVVGSGSPQACAPGGTATGIGGAAVAGTFSYTYNGSATVPSAAATYTVVATFASGNSNYASGGTAAGTFVIGAQPVVTVTLICTPATYDGNAHGCTATPNPVGASCTGLVSGTNAGIYAESVTCGLTGYVSGTNTGSLVINPATPTLSATCSGGVYNGAAYSCTGSATGVGGAAVSGSFAFAPGSETNVGSYPETGVFTSANTNYVSGGTATATLVISDATQSPSVSCPGPLTYDGNAHSCTITGGFGTCTSAAVSNVPGSGTLAVSCTGDSNHNAYSGTGSITINPATPTLLVSCGTVVGSGSPQACAPGGTATGIGGAAVAGTFSYTYNGSATIPSAAATYAVVATFASGNSNYASGGTAAGTFVIGAQPVVTVTLICTPATYDGNAHGCTATPNPVGASCTGLVSETNAGTYSESVTCGSTGYVSGSNTGSLVISPAIPTLTVLCAEVTYDGNAHSCTGTPTGVGGATVAGSFVFAPGSEIAAGSYAETGTFTSSDPNYANGGTATGTLKIDSATPTLALSCPSVTFDGNAHSCSATATGVSGAGAQQKSQLHMLAQLAQGASVNGSFACLPATETNAGAYPVTCTFTSSDPSYVSGGTVSGSLVITQATPTLSATCAGGIYNGTAYSCTGSATGVGGAVVAGSFSFSPGSETAAGSYAETGTFTSTDSNYVSGGSASGTLTITAASLYTVSGQISLINGGGMLQGATVSLGGLTATTDVNGNFTITNVPAGSYTLAPAYTFPTGSDPADSSVFYPASQSLTVSGDLTGQNFTAEVGYTVYGTVIYAGLADPTNVSQLYVNMRNTACSSCSPNGTSLVFEMPGPYTFTIHGVTPGTYTLQSWFDLSGYGSPNIADPMSNGDPVIVSTATGDVVATDPNSDMITLNDPASWPDLTSLPAPTLTVSPALDKGVIVYYQSIMSAGVEQATRYNLCWSSITGGGGDSDCQLSHPTKGGALSMNNSDAFWEDSGTGKIVILDGGDTSSIFYTKSPTSYRPADGSQYSFCLQGVNGNEVGGNWNCQHVTLAAPPTSSPAGTSTLVMSVKTPVKATGAVYAGCYDPVGNALYVHTDESKPAAGTHSYTVYGIPSTVANCNVVAAIDENNDGFLTPLDPDAGSLFGGLSGDIFNLGRNNTLTALTVGGSTTAPLLDLTPYHQNSSATLTTQNNLDPTGVQSYSINIDVRPLMRMPVGVELTSGPNVLQPIDFAPGCTTCGQGEFNVTVSTANQAPGGSYTLAVSDESTAAVPVTDTPTLAVSNVVGDFATNLSATGGTTPTFTWSYPVNNTSAYTYQFTLWDASGNVISQVPAQTGTGFASTTANSITSPVTLTSGTTYTWAVTSIDGNGNTAQQKATYQP